MDLAAPQLEPAIVERVNTGEVLGDALHLDQDVAHPARPSHGGVAQLSPRRAYARRSMALLERDGLGTLLIPVPYVIGITITDNI